MSTWEVTRLVFAEAAEWFVRTAAEVGDRWSLPGLGEWDVRALVGHTSRSLLTVEEYLTRTPERVDVETTAGYFRAMHTISVGPAVTQRGRDAGVALGPDPADAVARIAARVVPSLDDRDGTELLTTLAGGMRLADYLPTRTFELVVHTLDLAAALGIAAQPPTRPAEHTLRVVADLAVADGAAGPLLLAATGRTGLPPGFSVL